MGANKRAVPKKARNPRQALPKPVTVEINPANLTEDEADYLFYLKHKSEKRHSLDAVMNEAGYELDR